MQEEKMTVEDLVNDLTLTFNSCEAQDLYQLIVDKKRSKAFEILRTSYSEEDSNAIIDYYYAKHDKKISFKEVSVEDIEKIAEQKKYLFKIGNSLIQSKLYFERNEWTLFMDREGWVPITKASQIWEIV